MCWFKGNSHWLNQEYNGWWFLFLGSSRSPPGWQWLEMLFGPCQTCAEGRTHHLNLTRWGINPFLLMGPELVLEREPHQDPEVCYLERWSDTFKLNVCWSLLISNKVDGDGSISMKFCWDQGCQAAFETCLVPASFPLPSSLAVPKVSAMQAAPELGLCSLWWRTQNFGVCPNWNKPNVKI